MNGKIVAIYGNLVAAETETKVVQNSVGYCLRADGARLLSEVIRIRGHVVDLQVFEETRGLKAGDAVEFHDEMLSVTLGPGLLGQVYDGLQNPLPALAEKIGFFLKPGNYLPGLVAGREWEFTTVANVGGVGTSGSTRGTVP